MMGLHPGALHPPRRVVSVATDGDSIHHGALTASAPAGAVSGSRPGFADKEAYSEALWGCWN